MERVPSVLIRRPKHRSQVDRPRLSGLSVLGRLIVITGPSGTGKTILAGQLVDQLATSHRVGWCRLAPGWSRAANIPTLAAASLGQNPTLVAGDDLMLAADAILELLEANPTALVIDDLHESEGSEVERLLAEVVSYLPDDAAVIVTSRRRPTELIGLLDGAALSVVNASDLAFRTDETEALFAARGLQVEDPERLVESAGGWATVLSAAAEAGDVAGGTLPTVVGEVFSADRLGDLGPLAQAAAVLPYLTTEVAETLGVGDGSALDRLAETTSLVSQVGGAWRLHDSAAEVLGPTIDRDLGNRWRLSAAEVLAADDPASAIELLIAAGAHQEAGDLMASRASEIGADRATDWLYRVPAEVRQRMPPVLTGGRATVNVSLAILSARGLVEDAADDVQRSEGLLGLGSLLLASGDLAEAASAFESCLRVATTADTRRIASEHLAQARWFAGDTIGARAALTGCSEGSWAQWLLGVMAFVDDDLARAADHATASIEASDQPDMTIAPGTALRAAIAFDRGEADGTSLAAAAYEVAVAVGGRDLAAAGPVHGWSLHHAGDDEGALAVAEQIERTIGRHDFGARVQTALLRRSVSQTAPDLGDPDRDQRRVLDLRTRGYATVERLAQRLEGSHPTESADLLRVNLLGSFNCVVEGTTLSTAAWKSRKALEVCAFLSHTGPAGVSREQAIEAVWPDRAPDKGRTLLRTALSEVRRVLEPRRAAGQESRFVATDGDRVMVRGISDISRAHQAAEAGDHAEAFALLANGLAPDLPASDWIDELRPVVERLTVESAARLVRSPERPDLKVPAHEALIAAEPWNKEHFDALASHYRQAGDAPAANDVERRWFADD